MASPTTHCLACLLPILTHDSAWVSNHLKHITPYLRYENKHRKYYERLSEDRCYYCGYICGATDTVKDHIKHLFSLGNENCKDQMERYVRSNASTHGSSSSTQLDSNFPAGTSGTQHTWGSQQPLLNAPQNYGSSSSTLLDSNFPAGTSGTQHTWGTQQPLLNAPQNYGSSPSTPLASNFPASASGTQHTWGCQQPLINAPQNLPTYPAMAEGTTHDGQPVNFSTNQNFVSEEDTGMLTASGTQELTGSQQALSNAPQYPSTFPAMAGETTQDGQPVYSSIYQNPVPSEDDVFHAPPSFDEVMEGRIDPGKYWTYRWAKDQE